MTRDLRIETSASLTAQIEELKRIMLHFVPTPSTDASQLPTTSADPTPSVDVSQLPADEPQASWPSFATLPFTAPTLTQTQTRLKMLKFDKNPDENSMEFRAWIEQLKYFCMCSTMTESTKLSTLWWYADAWSKRRASQFLQNTPTASFDEMCSYLMSASTPSNVIQTRFLELLQVKQQEH